MGKAEFLRNITVIIIINNKLAVFLAGAARSDKPISPYISLWRRVDYNGETHSWHPHPAQCDSEIYYEHLQSDHAYAILRYATLGNRQLPGALRLRKFAGKLHGRQIGRSGQNDYNGCLAAPANNNSNGVTHKANNC